MIIRTYDTGDGWTIEFSRGVQTFTLDYNAEKEEDAVCMANILRDFLYEYKHDHKVPDTESNCNLQNVSESFSLDFVKWYSGMGKFKILNAFDRYIKESGNVR